MNRQFETFKQIICTFNFSNTYKAAWAKALIELSSELPIAENRMEITLSQIAEKYTKYYWDILIRNNYPQSSIVNKQPEVVTRVKDLIDIYYGVADSETPEYYEKAKDVIPKLELDNTIVNVTSILKKDVSYRFLMLNQTETDVYSYSKGDNSLWISSALVRDLCENKNHLLDLVHYRWGLLIDFFTGGIKTKKGTVITTETAINKDTLLKYETMLGIQKEAAPKRKIKRVIAVRKGNKLSVFQLERLVRERKNIGRILIDQYARETEFDDIHLQAIRELRKGLNSYYGTQIDREIVFISLAIIALKTYDGTFYEHVEDVYEELVDDYGVHRLEGLIRDTIRSYSSVEENEPTRLINPIIENTLVPLPYLGNYYEFCYDIYEKNFDYSIPEDLAAELKCVFEGIKEATATDGDGLTITGLNKTYKLIRTTKQIITEGKDVDDLVWLTGKIIQIIDRYYWNGKAHTANSYFRKGLKDWSEKYELSQVVRRENKNTWRSQWACQFALTSSNQVVLRTPPHKVNKDYSWETIRVFVFNNGQLVKECTNLDVRLVLGYYQIQPQEIVIDNPLGELVYIVIADSEELYSSQDRLVRDILVFDESGNEIGNYTDYEGTAYICTTNNSFGSRIYHSDNYNIYKMDVVPGSFFHYGAEAQVFLFASNTAPVLLGEQVTDCFAVQKNSKKKAFVYKSVDSLKFEIESNAKPEILVNNKELPLDANTLEKLEFVGKTRWNVSLNLTQPGEYDVTVYSCLEGQKTAIKRWFVCVDPALDYFYEEVSSGPYAQVEIASSFFEELTKAYTVSFESFDEKQFGFNMNGKHWYWLLPIPFPVYRLDGGSWRSMSTEYIWIEDLHVDSKVELYYACKNVIPRTPDFIELEEVELKNYLGRDWPYLEIGFLTNYKDRYAYMDLFFMGENWEVISQLRCYNKVCLDELKSRFDFNESTRTLTIQPVFIGRGDLTVEVKKDESVAYSSRINNEDECLPLSIPNIESFVPYTLSVYHEKRQLLGSRKELVGTISKRYFSENDFLNKTYQIKAVEYEQNIANQAMVKTCELKGTYLTFNDVETGIYKGTLFFKTLAGEEHTFDNINPVYIEICSEIYGDTIDLAIVKPMEDYGSLKNNYVNGDGLLLNVPKDEHRKGEIINGMDNNNAPDILTYHMTI